MPGRIKEGLIHRCLSAGGKTNGDFMCKAPEIDI